MCRTTFFWCTADVGWITGHTYGVYGPLLNGACTLLYNGVPDYPDSSRYWHIVEQHHVNTLYTSPTVLRSLMKNAPDAPLNYDLSSLKLLASVGEPIKEREWYWYRDTVGRGKLPIIDTYWQTETGSIIMTPDREVAFNKPSCIGKGLPLVEPVLLDHDNRETESPNGKLALRKAIPSMARELHPEWSRFHNTYIRNGYYLTGDTATRDSDGDYYITGRIDDLINVSGHLLGTVELENCLQNFPYIMESAIVGVSHPVKGTAIYAFATTTYPSQPSQLSQQSQHLLNDINQHIADSLGAVYKIERLVIVQELPKTRSGKIVRRLLKKVAEGEEELGDLSTLTDTSVIDHIREQLNDR